MTVSTASDLVTLRLLRDFWLEVLISHSWMPESEVLGSTLG